MPFTVKNAKNMYKCINRENEYVQYLLNSVLHFCQIWKIEYRVNSGKKYILFYYYYFLIFKIFTQDIF